MKKYQLGFTTDQFFTPLTRSTVGENADIAWRDGRSNTFGKMGADLIADINDETAFIKEEDWNSTNQFYRDGIDWSPDLTVGGAAKLAEVYDLDREYEYYKSRSTTANSIMRGTLNFGTMMIADEVNLIPFVGQFAKIGQGLKATSMVAKSLKAVTGPSATYKGAFGKGVAQTLPFTAVEAFYLSPESEKIRRQQDIGFLSQLVGFGLGSAAGGAFGMLGHKVSKMLSGAKERTNFQPKEDFETPEAKQRIDIVNEEQSKLNIANSKIVEIDLKDRPDITNNDLENIVLSNKTAKQSFDEDGMVSMNTNSATTVLSTRNTLSITTKRKTLQSVLEKIKAENLQVDTIRISVKGTRQRAVFTRDEILAIDPVLEKFKIKKTKSNNKSQALEVEFEGDTYAIIKNEKTGDPVAYKKQADGTYGQALDPITSKKVFHGAVTKNPEIKQQIKQDLDGQNKAPETQPVDAEADVEVRNQHSAKTHEDVADDLTGEGYANITTTEQLSTLPVTVGVEKKHITAINNGQTTATRTIFVNGEKVEKTTDLSILKNEIDELEVNKKLLEDVEGKLDDLMVCNATN